MAFCDEVRGYGAAAALVPEDTAGRIDIAGELAKCPVGTQVYSCGPEPLLRAVEAACSGDSRLGGLHFERFGSAAPTPVVSGGRRVLDVAPDQPWACREGYCGTCETKVIAGEPEHADDILSADERASNTVMMICVGRSRTPRLVLDI
jgi:ferredoxin